MLHFMDSFAHYDISQMDRKWLFQGGNSIENGINGGKALRLGPGGIALISVPSRSFVVIGFRVKFDRTQQGAEIYAALGVGRSRSARAYFSLFLLPDGSLAMYAGDAGTILGNSGSFVVHDNTWYYFEIKFSTFSGTSGGDKTVGVNGAILRIDGTTRITGTDGSAVVDETDWITPGGEVDIHRFESTAATNTGQFIQDLYIYDITSPNNDFAGDSHMGCIYPKADIEVDWVPSSGTAHFSLVNEHICDDDGTYIKSDNVGDRDEFDFDDVTVVGEINAAQYLICARKDDEGVRSIKATMNAVVFGDEQFVNDSYLYYRKPFDVNPPESAASFNARTWGVKIIS